MTDSAPLLSCEQCKRRKTKCDKGSPCSSCIATGFECRPVQRARLPRGRTGKVKKRNSALEDKVAKLEGLLHRIEAQVKEDENDASQNGVNNAMPAVTASSVPNGHNRVEQLVAKDFWLALSNEIFGLRETIEASDEEENIAAPNKLASHVRGDCRQSNSSVLFALSGYPEAQSLPSSIRETVFEAYKQRVDLLFKVMHWPSFAGQLQLPDNAKPLALLALENAVFFMGLCSIDQSFCDEQQLGNRINLLQYARQKAECYLQAAHLLTTTNYTVLQAFVLYLMAIRCCGDAAETWSLLALAIRIADTCGVRPTETSEKLSSFELEQRRRLWFSIGLLDSQVSFGRGSLPLLSRKDLINPPANVNDSEITGDNIEKRSYSSFTDMSFSHLCHGVMIGQRKLADPSFTKWENRLDIIAHFEDFVGQNFMQFEFSNDPLQRYVANCAKDMISSMHLLLRRPPYKQHGNSVPASDDFDVMGMACRVVQSGLFKAKHTEFAPYRWWMWPKWYALSILLVELLNARHGEARERAYGIAKESFQDYAQSASDANSALLWKPVVKLMRLVDNLVRSKVSEQSPADLSTNTLFTPGTNSIFDGPTSVSTTMSSGDMALPESYNDVSTPGIDWDIFLNNMDFSVLEDIETSEALQGQWVLNVG